MLAAIFEHQNTSFECGPCNLIMALVEPFHRSDRIGCDIVLLTALNFLLCCLSQLWPPLVDFKASGLHDAEQLVSPDHHLPHHEGVSVFG